MGHLIFVLLHLVMLASAPLALVVTIPAHLIYGAVRRPRQASPSTDTHVRCPDCRELVLRDASACKHCGCRLVPQPAPKPVGWVYPTRD